MNEEIIYFELNNWMPNKDYPNAEPFETWTSYEHFNFDNEDWIKENKLVVVRTIVDMSALLTKYTKFLRCPDADEELPYGRFGSPFYEYTNENIGWHFIDDEDY